MGSQSLYGHFSFPKPTYLKIRPVNLVMKEKLSPNTVDKKLIKTNSQEKELCPHLLRGFKGLPCARPSVGRGGLRAWGWVFPRAPGVGELGCGGEEAVLAPEGCRVGHAGPRTWNVDRCIKVSCRKVETHFTGHLGPVPSLLGVHIKLSEPPLFLPHPCSRRCHFLLSGGIFPLLNTQNAG